MSHMNVYINLLAQFDRVFRHNRQGSYKTKQRYGEAFKRLLHFLAEQYRLERISNIAPKHIFAYVEQLAAKGRSPAYIKTELAAIRFFHDQIPRVRHKLPDNRDLNLNRREYGKVDRTWSSAEFNRYLAKAIQHDREDYATIFCLARYGALRLHECFRMDTQTAAKAVKIGILTIKGKGGLVRDVPINLSIEIQLKKMLALTPRGHKLFVAADDKTHLAMHRFENFIYYHKTALQDPDSTRPMTFHGLRHICAAEWYKGFLAKGCIEKEARLKVARLLGHGRDDVTKVYLASLTDRGKEAGGGPDGC